MDADPGSGSQPATGGWRATQVAIVASLTLLLGIAAGALVAGSGGDVAGPATPTTDRRSPSSIAEEPGRRDGDEGGDGVGGDGVPGDAGEDEGASVVVGNSVYTASYQSNSDRSTELFDVGSDWQVRWDVAGGMLTIKVFDGTGAVVEVVEAEGRGQRSFPEAGTYRIEIDTDGSRYGVVVTDGP